MMGSFWETLNPKPYKLYTPIITPVDPFKGTPDFGKPPHCQAAKPFVEDFKVEVERAWTRRGAASTGLPKQSGFSIIRGPLKGVHTGSNRGM